MEDEKEMAAPSVTVDTPEFREILGNVYKRTSYNYLAPNAETGALIANINDWQRAVTAQAVSDAYAKGRANGARDEAAQLKAEHAEAVEAAKREGWDSCAQANQELIRQLRGQIAQASAPVEAWITEDGERVVTARTMEGAKKDGGAMLSSMRPFSVALVRADNCQQQGAEPAKPALPSTPEEVVAFIGSHFGSMDVDGPLEDRHVRMSIHDLLSAFRDWRDFPPDPAEQQHAQAARPRATGNQPAQPIAGEMPALPEPDVIAYVPHGPNDAYSKSRVSTYGHQCRAAGFTAALGKAAVMFDKMVGGKHFAIAIRALNKTEG